VWTLRGLNAMWQERLDDNIALERQLGKDEDKLIGLWQMKKYRPFYVNGEYDSWHFWKTDERRMDGQFPVFIIDLANDPGGWEPCRDIFEMYEKILAEKNRYSCEQPKRDGNGQVILWRMMLTSTA
jgi:hypothetical protein